MSSTTAIIATDQFGPPSQDAFNCNQIDLFQYFLCNNNSQRERLSNAVPLWDCLPLYSMSRQAAQRMRKAGTFPHLLNIPCRYSGQDFIVEIQPARIADKNGVVTEYYPGANEDLIEDALRKISTLQNHGFFDESCRQGRSGVFFTGYQLREELNKLGHSRSHKEIVLSLGILSRSILTLKTQGKKNKAVDTSPYFPRLTCVTRHDYLDDPKAKWYVEFHPLITQAIRLIEYRQYDYALMMKHSTQLARWLHKYLVVKFTWARIGEKFEIRYSTIKRDSGLLEGYSRDRDATDAVKKAFKELTDNGVLQSFDDNNKILSGRGKIEDIVFALYPTVSFSMEIKASNKRKGENQSQPDNDVGIGRGLCKKDGGLARIGMEE